jgi:ferritin-like metal-binding protein YciE
MAKEGTSLIRKTDPALVDGVVLSAALGTEYYEISAYQTLVASAEAMGAREVVALLKENLQQEEHTSEELNAVAKKVAATV